MESLSAIAISGTANDKMRTRNTAAANSALAASGVKLGACGTRRATTSRPISPAASRTSGTIVEARHIPIRDIDFIFHLLRSAKTPCPEPGPRTPRSCGRHRSCSPILPVLRAGSPALVLKVVDLGQECRCATAGVRKRDPVRVCLRAIQDVENRIALRPGKSIEYFCHPVAVVDDQAHRLRRPLGGGPHHEASGKDQHRR